MSTQAQSKTVDKKFGGIIKNWYLFGTMVYGNLYQDPQERFVEGGFIRTSEVVRILGNKLETVNTIYDLGEPYVSESSQSWPDSQSKSCTGLQ